MTKWKYILGLVFLLLPYSALATTGDLGVSQGDIYLSDPKPVESTSTRIYATIHNFGTIDGLGSVRFTSDLSGQIGSDQPISLISGKTDDVFVDWLPNSGQHTITINIIPWTPATDDPSNNSTTFSISVDKDTDGDGVGDNIDIDDDNDGIPDTSDLFPLNPNESIDTDGDGIGNNADTDDDNDGIPDSSDALPLDPTESLDNDNDGIGNNTDTDDDNDGISDIQEDINQNGIVDLGETDPLNSDTDNDGVTDSTDIFPINSNESADFDGDGVGNNTDIDDDNDGVIDTEDVAPFNQGPIINAGDSTRSANIGNDVIIDATESVDLDGEIVNTVMIVEKTIPGSYRSSSSSASNGIIRANSEDGVVTLDSIEDIIEVYFEDYSTMKELKQDENGNFIFNFNDATKKPQVYKFVGNNLKTNFTEKGTYIVTVIAQDDKNETRSEEIIITIKDYHGIFVRMILILAILLAILLAVKYILRAKKREKRLKQLKKSRKRSK